jgi:hypothetical protein
VQRLLNHADLKTTTRYAHVLDADVADALEQVTKSPNRSPSAKRKLPPQSGGLGVPSSNLGAPTTTRWKRRRAVTTCTRYIFGNAPSTQRVHQRGLCVGISIHKP